MEYGDNKMKFLDIIFPKRYCEGCGDKIENGWVGTFHQYYCIKSILGYGYEDEKFEPSSKVYFFMNKNIR